MTSVDLVQEARLFERSSEFRFGDRTGFSVKLADDLLLKGRRSAGAYLDSLGLAELPERVMIVCPGNGGLVTECYRRGAKRVIAMEPRMRFKKSLWHVLKLQERVWAEEEKKDLSYRIVTSWEQVRKNSGFQDVDLVLWPEGLEDTTRPRGVFLDLDTAINPGGKLMLDATLGRHNWVEKINSWRPSEHAIIAMAKEIFGGAPEATIPSTKGDGSRVFVIAKPGAEPAKKVARKKKKKKVSKKTAKKVTPKKKVAEKKPEKVEEMPLVILDEAPLASVEQIGVLKEVLRESRKEDSAPLLEDKLEDKPKVDEE